MWAIDTSWLVALFDPGDTFHKRAQSEAQEPDAMLVNPIILVEFLNVVRRTSDRQASLQALADLQQLPHVRFLAAAKVPTLARVFGKSAGISWQDASAVATALDEGAGLRTFDGAQRKAFEALK